MAVAAAAGEASKAGLGLLLSDPNVTGPTIRHVLPGAVLYDLLLTPVVYWLVSRVARLARPVSERAPAPVFFGAQRLASVFRLASARTGAPPRICGWPAPARSTPTRARPAASRSCGWQTLDQIPSPERTVAPTNSAQLPLAGGRATKLNFAHSGSTLRSAGSAPRRPRPEAELRALRQHPPQRGQRAARPGRTPKLNFAGRPARDHAARRRRARARAGSTTAGASRRRPSGPEAG